MIYLRKGDNIKNAPEKASWITSLQTILASFDCYEGDYTPYFGPKTTESLSKLQKRNGLGADGVLGSDTLGMLLGPCGWDPPDSLLKAALAGGDIDEPTVAKLVDTPDPDAPRVTIDSPREMKYMNQLYPQPLDADADGRGDLVYLGEDGRQKLFGPLKFTVDANNKVDVDDAWENEWIVPIVVPQLSGVQCYGRTHSGKVQFHKKAVFQLLGAFQEIQERGLRPALLSYGGSYVPRFIRGSTTRLSNHTFGVAFDINHEWNGLGQQPALVGMKGSLRELVQIFEKWGFFWGGHYRNRKDGMHFECVKVISVAERGVMVAELKHTEHMTQWLESA